MNVTRSRARQLRRNPTDVERLLWRRLRFWQVDACKFRRQQPLGRYIVNFQCLQKRLIVELDGGQHAERERDGWLRDQGFAVLRFWNNAVMQNIDGVTEKIAKPEKHPYLNPSPQGGRKKIRNPKHSARSALE